MPPILLAHGSGGEESGTLINTLFYRYFDNPILAQNEDAALCPMVGETLVVSTDGYTVSPLFFNGANIGSLAICGTCNDVAMRGGEPRYLTVSVIIEEGFSYEKLEIIVQEMATKAAQIGVQIVTGDTKVVPKGAADGLFITTTGIGMHYSKNIGCKHLSPEHIILLSSPIGSHGATLFSAREGIELESNIKSDCRHLWPSVKALIDQGAYPIAMRDATRGGIAAVLNEWAKEAGVEIMIEEEAIPVQQEVKGICELLGFDPLTLANEGCFLVAVAPDNASTALSILQHFQSEAAIIGKVIGEGKRVLLHSSYDTIRVLYAPNGELLPRIC